MNFDKAEKEQKLIWDSHRGHIDAVFHDDAQRLHGINIGYIVRVADDVYSIDDGDGWVYFIRKLNELWDVERVAFAEAYELVTQKIRRLETWVRNFEVIDEDAAEEPRNPQS